MWWACLWQSICGRSAASWHQQFVLLLSHLMRRKPLEGAEWVVNLVLSLIQQPYMLSVRICPHQFLDKNPGHFLPWFLANTVGLLGVLQDDVEGTDSWSALSLLKMWLTAESTKCCWVFYENPLLKNWQVSRDGSYCFIRWPYWKARCVHSFLERNEGWGVPTGEPRRSL